MFFARVIELFFSVYILLLFIRVMSSWIPSLQHTKFILFVSRMTDPYLNLFRRFIPPIGGVIDLSPIIAFITLQFLQKFCMHLFL